MNLFRILCILYANPLLHTSLIIFSLVLGGREPGDWDAHSTDTGVKSWRHGLPLTWSGGGWKKTGRISTNQKSKNSEWSVLEGQDEGGRGKEDNHVNTSDSQAHNS
jgi:hypothetical protein